MSVLFTRLLFCSRFTLVAQHRLCLLVTYAFFVLFPSYPLAWFIDIFWYFAHFLYSSVYGCSYFLWYWHLYIHICIFFYCYPYNQLLLFYFLCMKDHFYHFYSDLQWEYMYTLLWLLSSFWHISSHYKWIGILYRVIEIFISHNCSEFFPLKFHGVLYLFMP